MQEHAKPIDDRMAAPARGGKELRFKWHIHNVDNRRW
jgi:hypothetical protein